MKQKKKEEEKIKVKSFHDIKTSIIEEITKKYTLDSLELLKKAAMGDTDAQLAVGIYRLEGYLIKNARTLEWYNKAVKNGDSESAYRLGKAYTFGGYGLKQDFQEAEKLLSKASANEHAEAQASLGILYCEGKRLPKNQEEGMRLLLQAKNNGSDLAKDYLNSQQNYKTQSHTNP